MRAWLHKVWRWCRLADVPTVKTPVPQCDHCDERATVFISVRWMGGDPRRYQFCQRHKPNNYRV